MKAWRVQDAKVHFSQLLDACMTDGPQMLTRRGAEAAVLVPIAEWRRLHAPARPSLKQLLLTDEARTDTLIPKRSGVPRRRTVKFD
ncbi:MAG: type toxin-antitoxin system Phd/YefM family antitoxin [Rhizobacter sp.]|nr:type toxin-antitoxin system Phd/YefM family antitoxin [Rhizobacter sp.]